MKMASTASAGRRARPKDQPQLAQPDGLVDQGASTRKGRGAAPAGDSGRAAGVTTVDSQPGVKGAISTQPAQVPGQTPQTLLPPLLTPRNAESGAGGSPVGLAACSRWAGSPAPLADRPPGPHRGRHPGAGGRGRAPWGPGLCAGLARLQPFGLSSHLFLVAAGLMWESAVGVPSGLLGMMLAAPTARRRALDGGREAVQARIPAGWL